MCQDPDFHKRQSGHMVLQTTCRMPDVAAFEVLAMSGDGIRLAIHHYLLTSGAGEGDDWNGPASKRPMRSMVALPMR